MRLVLLVVRVKLLGLRHHPSVKRVRLLADDLDHDGLVHPVGDDIADQLLASLMDPLGCCFGHDYFLSPTAVVSRCRMMVLTLAMSLRSPRIFFRLSVCPMLSWNFSLNS